MDEHIEAALMYAGHQVSVLQENESRIIDKMWGLKKDAERWRVMRDCCAWTMTSANGIVRVAFRVPVELEDVAETGDDLNDLADAALELFNK